MCFLLHASSFNKQEPQHDIAEVLRTALVAWNYWQLFASMSIL